MDESTRLLLEIVGCPEVGTAQHDPGHPCHEVVAFQRRKFPDSHVWQPPTPWVGHLDQAPILFIGSNPNIGGREYYPRPDWTDQQRVEFFDAAFDDVQIKDGKYGRQADGSWGPWVRTWAAVRRRAEELLERRTRPGTDYAMTELVRCRSQNEIGVQAARTRCADRYLDRTLELSPARVIVSLGVHTQTWLRERWSLDRSLVSQIELAGKTRLVAFLPHPTSRASAKTFAGVMPQHLERLRRAAQV